jgi:stage II sporulation protein E
VLTAFSVFIPEIIRSYFNNFLLYDVIIVFFKTAAAFALFLIFSITLSVLLNRPKRFAYTNEEIISTATVAALAVTGIGNLLVIGLSLRNILCIVIIFIFSYRYGAGVGAAIGIIAGFMASFNTVVDPMVVSSFAFCGLLAGIFRSLGKPGAALGFVVGNAVFTFYLNGSVEVLIHISEILVAAGIFLIIPKKVIDLLSEGFNKKGELYYDKKGYSLRVKEIAVEKLNKFSVAFRELSKTFSELSQTAVVTDKKDISAMLDRVAERACKDCSLKAHCWDRNFYSTYQVLFKIIECLEAKGRIEKNDVPEYFLDRCGRINEFVDAVNSMYEMFRVELVWRGRMSESRNLVSQQLEGMSKVIANLSGEIDMDINFKKEFEDRILAELNRFGMKANEVIALENKWGKYEVSAFHRGCGGKRYCYAGIEKLVSDIVGRRMIRESSECHHSSKESGCCIKLVEEEAYKVTTGIARQPKLEQAPSGDSYTFFNTGDGKYVIGLSDGMGSGQKASIQSGVTINLLEQFIEAGFDKDTTIKLINSILVLKSNDECYSTIDLSILDLYDAKAEFVKIGAVPTFILSKDKVEMIKSPSVPAGILNNICMEHIYKQLNSGDLVIMMTDGIVESFSSGESSEYELKEFMRGIESINPQEIADQLMKKAYDNCAGIPVDDMLVMVSKIWKKSA